MDEFRKALAFTVLAEGEGYTNDPKDSGGETKFGVTAATARANGYMGPMKDMPASVAEAIYRKIWDRLKLAAVASLYPKVAYEVFDSAVNLGEGQAGTWLQRTLNSLNNEGTEYKDMLVDGQIGGETLSALRAFYDRRGAVGGLVLLAALNGLQASAYISITEKRPKDERFVYGWLAKRVVAQPE